MPTDPKPNHPLPEEKEWNGYAARIWQAASILGDQKEAYRLIEELILEVERRGKAEGREHLRKELEANLTEAGRALPYAAGGIIKKHLARLSATAEREGGETNQNL